MNTCKSCKKKTKNKFFCNVICQRKNEHKLFIVRWKKGLEKGHRGKNLLTSMHVRGYLLNKYNSSCVQCGWNKSHPIDGKPLVEVDHIDGNAENCKENNLRLLCPNCHSMTPTFRRRNKNSKRIR